MAMLIGAAAGWKSDAVAAHQQFTLWHCLKKRGEFFMCGHAGRVSGSAALIATREFPTPACHTIATRLHGDRRLALPCIAFIQRFAANFGRAMHDKNKPRQR